MRKARGAVPRLTRTEWGWAYYDVAFSAFAILSTAFLPIQLKLEGAAAGLGNAVTTAQWGYVQSLSTLLLALLAPLLGAVADFKGKKKIVFGVFFVLGIGSLALMLAAGNYYVLLAANFICAVGYSGTNLVYDAYLVDVTEPKRMNLVSSMGFAAGYAGRCLPYLAGIVLYAVQPLGMGALGAIRCSIGITLLWWAGFSIPFFGRVKQRFGSGERPRRLIAASFFNMLRTLRAIAKNRDMALFLLAYFFYIDGVNTLISMSSDFGYDVGVSVTTMALALLATQIIAAPSVLVFERLARRFTTKNVILVTVCCFAAICAYALVLRQSWQFWVLAVSTGLVLGAVQALSRSYFARMIPDSDRSNEYFGFFNVLARYSSVLGPLMIAAFTMGTGSSRYGVASIVLLFALGFALLTRVRNLDRAA